MAGGGKVRIADRDNFGELARVVNGRLLVSSTGGGGGGSVDITSVGGVPIGPTVPVSGTVSVTQPVTVNGTITVSSITAPVTIVDPVVVDQGTSPWVVSGTIAVGGTVAVTQSTSPWVVSGTVAVSNFPATQPVSGTVTALQGTSPWVVSGTIAVGGTVAVTQSTSPWVVSGTVTIGSQPIQVVNPTTHDLMLTQGKIEDSQGVFGSPGRLLAVRAQGDNVDTDVDTNAGLMIALPSTSLPEIGGASFPKLNGAEPLYTDESGNLSTASFIVGRVTTARRVLDIVSEGEDMGAPPFSVGDVRGAIIAAVANEVPDNTPAVEGGFTFLRTDLNRKLWIFGGGGVIDTVGAVGGVGSVTPGTTANELGKAEDAAHASGHVGVMALAVRRDTPSSLAGSNNDYLPLTTDSLGRLWTRPAGDTMTTLPLSASTRGRPIQITATASTGTTLHVATTTAGTIDKLYIFLSNTSTASVIVTIEFGTTGGGFEKDYVVPANDTILAVDGEVIGGAATDTITAFATTGSVIQASGRVERLTA